MKIAVLPGDGIGPEIMKQALKVLEALSREGRNFELQEAPIGGAGYESGGDPLPESTLALAKSAQAVLLGAVGGPKYDSLPRPMRQRSAGCLQSSLGTPDMRSVSVRIGTHARIL